MRRAALGAALTVIVAVLVFQAVAAPVGVPAFDVIPQIPGGPPAAGEALSPLTVWASWHIDFGFEERSYRVIQSDDEWQALWSAIRSNPAPPPEVDFATRTVIAAFFGVASTGGFSIAIVDVVLGEDGTVRVLAETESPGMRCGVMAVITYPVHMVSISKSYGSLTVDETAVVHPCESP